MSEEMIEHKEFTCPVCGSHKFGSAELKGSYRRFCHGYVSVGVTRQDGFTPSKNCTFSFDISHDDRYFKGTGHFFPASGTAIMVDKPKP